MAHTRTHPIPIPISPSERLGALGSDRRRAAYEDGRLTRAELPVWAALWPEEVPLINGELPWIAAYAE